MYSFSYMFLSFAFTATFISKLSSFFSIWSKIIILHAPALEDTSAEKQEEVDDILPKLFKDGPKCVLYNLSFAKMFDDWETNRADSLK